MVAILQARDKQFLLDGEPFQILSGAIHYFRVVPEYWEDRLLKLKACGFNTVETYVPWNLHEPQENVYNFDGIANIERFITLAGELGLHVIVRPSPYICAEWEFGGLPAWLLQYTYMKLRCMDATYLMKVDRYYDELIPRLTRLQSTNGGPIIAMQIENEYGSYGNDTAYLTYLREGLTKRGVDVLLFTSDGPEDGMLQGGTIPGTLATVNFGSRPEEAFEKFREYRADEPLMCMEYWNGWFDHWLKPHHTRDAGDVADVFDRMLRAGASVNFYMFHGGTNFGFYNGANFAEKYEATITSYDYDSPLSECGDETEKFRAVRSVIARYLEKDEKEFSAFPAPIAKKSYGRVALTEKADLLGQLSQLSTPIQRTCPEPMEMFGQSYGFIVYSTQVSGPRTGEKLHLQEVHDRAQIFLDGVYRGTIERWDPRPLPLDIPAEGARLDIVVENMGRVNYGPKLKDYKGITEGVRFNNQFLFDWTIYPLPLDKVDAIPFVRSMKNVEQDETQDQERPTFYRGEFHVEEAGDTFIRLDGWSKGVVWINGFNLGRYWEKGPQRTLYVPAPLLRKGSNEIIVFELHRTEEPVVVLTDSPDLG
ncbi:beta-galactosidase [Paenibacillus sp. CGMCC 1.16610]|uniref:Beta-galactosidase n=1 Tax=Paenibacillus anseongense TaxID=2682845 RepID=A0ABW9U049_9BACL|nr:beta-galactosidase [Paenibacillus sp. CGMCC 1.16610]MBA2942972.1 beta-galactosidase [Paenibacillus sp. CGMCC 1.16610]MVQ33469.1 beta-galactosidase [Paenibacillus anseongense]